MNKVWLVMLACLSGCTCYTVDPGNRGVKVNLGEVDPRVLPEGFGWKSPLTSVAEVSVRQHTRVAEADAFSSDLQQLTVKLQVLYRIPEASVVRVFRDYAGDPFETLVAPRVQEAFKEVTALHTAEQITKQREAIKVTALEGARKKLGDILIIDDLIIENLALSAQLTHAIEEKMVQEQEAAKAKFIQQKAEIETATVVVRARGEAEAIRIRGEALRANPSFIQLQLAEKWDGKAPLVIGAGAEGGRFLLPLGPISK